MSEVGMLVLIEAGETRTFVTPSFRMLLPEVLIWGVEVVPRIEVIATETDLWPANQQLEFAAVIDRDSRRLVTAGASGAFDTPYQLMLFDQMLSDAWPGFQIDRIDLSTDGLADALGIDPPDTDKSLAEQLFNEAIDSGDDEDDEHDWDENEYEMPADEDAFGPNTDFRQLTESSPAKPNDLDADIQWWVSIRTAADQSFQHFHGNFMLQTLASSGPDVLARFADLIETPLPKEQETRQGIVIDAAAQSISVWSHPRGVRQMELSDAWSAWSVEHWPRNGFRQHLKATGADAEYVQSSDLEVLSEFVPALAEQVDFSEMMGELKSGIRNFVRRGFGCLAMVLAIPALLAWAVSGSWQGPFTFAAAVWVLAYLAYRFMAAKMKKNFSSISSGALNQDRLLPKLAPESKEERIRILNESLRGAGFPEFDQIQAYAQRDDDDDVETIEPIVKPSDLS